VYDKLLAVGIMVLVYALIVSERVHRTTAVLLGVVLVLGLGILSLQEAVDCVNWEALGLIFGMFILVAALTESGFFRWIGLHALRVARFRASRVFLLFCGLTAVLAAFMDSITVMIFMGSLALEACRVLEIRPAPFLIGLITSANIGGSATMVGDPPNVIIGTTLHYSFLDFVANTGLVALAAFAMNAGFFYLFYRRREFIRHETRAEEILAKHRELEPFSAVKDLHLLRVSLVVFAFTVTLLVLHQLLDLVVAYVALLGATLVLIFGGKDMPELVTKIDWHTLVFLGGLFVIVGGLERTGVLGDAARALESVSGGSTVLLLSLVLWSSALFSMVLDNIPFAAAMVPVIRELSLQNGAPLAPLAWSLALGTDIGGSATPIGASANVVGLAVAEKSGLRVHWPEYLRVAVPATLLTIGVCNLLLWIRYA
jgi:Na+/H+ antiporter NhaD/arsenite permease-like protein